MVNLNKRDNVEYKMQKLINEKKSLLKRGNTLVPTFN